MSTLTYTYAESPRLSDRQSAFQAKKTMSPVTIRHWAHWYLTLYLEENPFPDFGVGTYASYPVRCSFFSIWSKILRRVRRADSAATLKPMQPTQRRWRDAAMTKG